METSPSGFDSIAVDEPNLKDQRIRADRRLLRSITTRRAQRWKRATSPIVTTRALSSESKCQCLYKWSVGIVGEEPSHFLIDRVPRVPSTAQLGPSAVEGTQGEVHWSWPTTQGRGTDTNDERGYEIPVPKRDERSVRSGGQAAQPSTRRVAARRSSDQGIARGRRGGCTATRTRSGIPASTWRRRRDAYRRCHASPATRSLRWCSCARRPRRRRGRCGGCACARTRRGRMVQT